MTVHECIESIDRKMPNAFDEKTKTEWLTQVDAYVAREIMALSYPVVYVYPRDLGCHLLLPKPYDRVYQDYLAAMMCLFTKEYMAYNAFAVQYNETLEDYRRFMRRTRRKRASIKLEL